MAAVGTHLSTPTTPGLSRLGMMQARLRENIMLEKQTRLLEMAARQEADREDMIHRVTKSSANSSLSSSMSSLSNSSGAQGRVRRMFEERRNHPSKGGYHNSPKGFDKSNPLEPIRKEMPKGVIKARGNSVDRGARGYDQPPIGRSRSLAPTQKINRGDSRDSFKPHTSRPAPTRSITHHKSTSSLMDKNNGYGGGYSNGYVSPPDPSSTKSSPGPREAPLAPRRGSYNPPSRKSYEKENKFNGRNGNYNDDDITPTPSPKPRAARPPPKAAPKRAPPPRKPSKPNYLSVSGGIDETDRASSPASSPTSTGGGGFLGKMGFGKKPSTAAPSTSRSQKPPPTRSGPKDPNLSECKICGRCFAPDRIEKHQDICKKAKQKAKKRKVMDPTVMRTKGTEAEMYVKRGAHLIEPTKKKKNGNWRKQHEEFIATIRAAKGIKGYVAPPVDTSDYIKCQHCGRNFSEAAADRHIPKCATITSNKTKASRAPNANGFGR